MITFSDPDSYRAVGAACLDASPCPTWICRADTLEHVAANSAAWLRFGSSTGRLSRAPVLPADAPAKLTAPGTLLLRVAAGVLEDVPVRITAPVQAADGLVHVVFADLAPKVSILFGVGDPQPTTGRVLQRHVAEMPLAYIAWDTGSRVTAWNPAAVRIFGHAESDALGRHVSFLAAEVQRPDVDDVWHRLMAGDRTAHSMHQCVRRDGRRIVCDWTNTPVVSAGGRVLGAFSIVADVTERYARESRVAEIRAAEAVSAFAGEVAHDLNNLLTGLLGFGELALERVDRDSPSFEATEQMVAAGHRGAVLSERLAGMGRLHTNEPERVSVSAVVEAALAAKSARMMSIDLATELLPDAGHVDVDFEGCVQAVAELIDNACDAMGDRGRLVVSTDPVTVSVENAPAFGDVRPGDCVAIRVQDSGPGITPEVMQRIFEPFFTTKGRRFAKGLGLPVARATVRRSGGEILSSSRPQQGSMFTVLLPITDAPGARPPHVTSPLVVAGADEGDWPREDVRVSVLVIDDDPGIRIFSEMVLEHAGYDVHVASSVPDGLAVVRSQPLHLVVADVLMPDRDGIALVRDLKLSRPSLPVLAISGGGRVQPGYYLDLMKGFGAAGILQKPFDAEELLRVVRQLTYRTVD